MRDMILIALGGLALAGCGASLSDVPGLGPRPVEHRPILPPDAASEPLAPADPALIGRLAGLVADAMTADTAFERRRAAVAETMIRARNAGEGSEAWIAGQQALSALDAARAPVRDAAAEIDALRVDPAHAGAGDRAAIDAAAVRIAVLSDREAAMIAAAGPG